MKGNEKMWVVVRFFPFDKVLCYFIPLHYAPFYFLPIHYFIAFIFFLQWAYILLATFVYLTAYFQLFIFLEDYPKFIILFSHLVFEHQHHAMQWSFHFLLRWVCLWATRIIIILYGRVGTVRMLLWRRRGNESIKIGCLREVDELI